MHTAKNKVLLTIRWVAVLALGIGSLLLIWITWPVSSQTYSLAVSAANRTLPDESIAAPLQIQQPVTLNWELVTRMHAGQVGPIRLKISIPSTPDSSSGTDVFLTYRVYLVSRIDAGQNPILPRGELVKEIQPGIPLELIWSFQPAYAGTYHGTAWVYFRFVPKEGGEIREQPVVSRDFSITVDSFFGIQPEVIRWMGFGLFAAGSLGCFFSFKRKK